MGTIVSALLSTGTVQTNPAGLTYAVATYELVYRGANASPILYDVYWVLEGERWSIWFSARR